MVTLENIEQHTVPFDQFELKWRFTEEKYNILPAHHLEQIRPLDKPASKMLNKLTHTMFGTHFRLDPSKFKHIKDVHIPGSVEDEQVTSEWLYQRGLPFDREVYVSWHSDFGAITSWKMVVKYWSDFWYPMSDDLMVIDRSLSWALAIYHYEQMEFGTNAERYSKICENELIGTDTL